MINRKNVLITGASGGIGAAVAEAFASADYDVFVCFHHGEKTAQTLAERLRKTYGVDAIAAGCDVSDPRNVSDAIDQFVKQFGHIDALVTCAGVADIGLFTDITDDRWDSIIRTNLSGTAYACREAARHMVRQHSGSIVTVSSMWGQVGASCEVAYSAAKAGIIGLSKALAKELGPSGIRVNCVAPGMIDTPMNGNLSEDTVREIAEDTPLGRIGTPAEVAKACLFLASDEASFITGQVMGVNGGLVI